MTLLPSFLCLWDILSLNCRKHSSLCFVLSLCTALSLTPCFYHLFFNFYLPLLSLSFPCLLTFSDLSIISASPCGPHLLLSHYSFHLPDNTMTVHNTHNCTLFPSPFSHLEPQGQGQGQGQLQGPHFGYQQGMSNQRSGYGNVQGQGVYVTLKLSSLMLFDWTVKWFYVVVSK